MSSKIHIPLDRGVMEPKDIMVTIRGGGELLLSIQADRVAQVAYTEVRGQGLATVDLSYTLGALQEGVSPVAFLDQNEDGTDDRVSHIVPESSIFSTSTQVDQKRGLAYVSGSSSGITVVTTRKLPEVKAESPVQVKTTIDRINGTVCELIPELEFSLDSEAEVTIKIHDQVIGEEHVLRPAGEHGIPIPTELVILAGQIGS